MNFEVAIILLSLLSAHCKKPVWQLVFNILNVIFIKSYLQLIHKLSIIFKIRLLIKIQPFRYEIMNLSEHHTSKKFQSQDRLIIIQSINQVLEISIYLIIEFIIIRLNVFLKLDVLFFSYNINQCVQTPSNLNYAIIVKFYTIFRRKYC